MAELRVRTKKKREVVDITNQVQKVVKNAQGARLCHVCVRHTTAALAVADLDPGGTDQDYLDAFEEIVPPHGSDTRRGAGKIAYRHPHNPAHMPDHILSTLIGTSLTLPVQDRALVLGSWQSIVLFELDGPRERHIVITCI